MKPARFDRSSYPYQPLPTDEWKNKLLELDPRDRDSEPIRKFVDNPAAIPTEDELNRLILKCMTQGATDTLFTLLTQEHPQTLRITSPIEESAWETLLKAMPASCSFSRLTLSGQTLDRGRASLLFETMGRMPELQILDIHSCKVDFSAQLELSCPPFPELQNLHVEGTQTPYALLRPILEVSNLSTVYLQSNPGMDDETHFLLTKALCNHAATLQELTLRGLQGCKNLDQYVSVIQQATKLACLDLSLNDLSPLNCEGLLNALKGKSTLTSLSLARCWRRMDDKSDWRDLAMLIKHPSLVSLDLSRNKFPSSMAPVMLAIPGHPSLQHLNLSGFAMTNELITIVLPAILENNKTLVSLQLPTLDDDDFAPLVKAMEQNHVLRSLPIPSLEQWCSTMSEEESHRLFPNYLAVMEHVALNRRAWEEKRFALMEGAMKVVLGGLGRIDPGRVFQEIARYAAGHVAIEGNGNEAAMALTLLNKKAHEEGQAALERLQKEK